MDSLEDKLLSYSIFYKYLISREQSLFNNKQTWEFARFRAKLMQHQLKEALYSWLP